MWSTGHREQHRPTGAPRAVVVTAIDGLDHLVPDTVLARSRDGSYPAACGSTITGAPLAAAPGPACPLCGPPPGRRH
jgi:hypothetical protein